MYLQEQLAAESSSTAIAELSGKVQRDCLVAKRFFDRGQQEAARKALSEVWQRIGERPNLEGLDELTQAELLLRVGIISSTIGSVSQIEGAQEFAKDLISESARIFERAGLNER